MADILIRKVDDKVKAALKRRAERRGRSLEAELRDALVKLAHEQAPSPDDSEPFGTWAVRITRPGVDLDEILKVLRSAPVRPAKFD